jgi:hypothetical protein
VGPDALDEAGQVVPVIVEDRVWTSAMVSPHGRDEDEALTQRLLPPDLNLGIFPPRHLDDKVDNLLVLLVRVERDVVPE